MTVKTMFSSKYALSSGSITRGSYEVDSEAQYGRRANARWYSLQKIGRDLHEIETDAIAAAHAARHRKIKSLEKQIAKLEAMKFVVEAEPAD